MDALHPIIRLNIAIPVAEISQHFHKCFPRRWWNAPLSIRQSDAATWPRFCLWGWIDTAEQLDDDGPKYKLTVLKEMYGGKMEMATSAWLKSRPHCAMKEQQVWSRPSHRTGMAFKDKCQHVVDSLCLVSSANKVHVRGKSSVSSRLKPHNSWVIHFQKYRLGLRKTWEKKKEKSIQSSKRLSSLDVNAVQEEGVCCISIIQETDERLQQLLRQTSLTPIGLLKKKRKPHFPASPFTCDLRESFNLKLVWSVQDSSISGVEALCIWTSCGLGWAATAERGRKARAWFAFRAVFTALDGNDKPERLRENLIISPLTGLDLIICTSKSAASPSSADYSVPGG